MNALSGDALIEKAEAIQSKDDFSAFIQLLLQNYRAFPEEWENAELESFLQALGAFAEELQHYYANIKADVDLKSPTWRVFADILLAARVYE
jgi:hypothetical protein